MAKNAKSNDSIFSFATKNGLVVTSDGKVDINLTMQKITDSINDEMEKMQTLNSQIATHVASVYGNVPTGTAVTVNAIAGVVANRMTKDLNQAAVIRMQVANYLRDSDGYEIRRGRNGGVIKL